MTKRRFGDGFLVVGVRRVPARVVSGTFGTFSGWGGITTSFILRPCAKDWCFYSVFASLSNILHKDVEQANLSQASMPFTTVPKNTGILQRFMPKTLMFLQRFRLFVLHTAQGCGTRKSITSVHAFRDHAQKHWYLQLFMPKTLVFTALPCKKKPST